MNHLDLFSGIGGFSLGFEATQRIKTVAFCEIDSFCTKVLNKNWPTVPVYNDIKELTYEKLKANRLIPIDILTGGYPCQPFSVAGLKKGEKDPRHLWPEYFRLIKECRPTWVIGENVSGHIKLGLDTVHQDLESEGYTFRTFSISAASIGANHQRERIWTVAYSQRNCDFNKEQRGDGEEKKISREHRKDDSTTRQSSGTSTVWKTGNEHANVEDARRRSWGEQFTRNKESLGRGTFEKTERSTNTDTTSRSSEGATPVANTSSIKSNGRENIDAKKSRKGQGEFRGKSCHEEPNRNWWHTEPDVGRVADGIPDRTHRLKALGNSVVPQIPYYIATTILEVIDA